MCNINVRFLVFMAVMTVLFFWVETLCRLIGEYQHFGEIYISIFRAEDGDCVSLKC
jgi:hypothetical protein